ncbi:zinc-alpha-2-glycoprotein-like [Paramisgurnus dabryanus]|uniref:zinc-alpha-2-glycoprotein-like n=1 Tax=Paramisgurnus dabryanus TaxID=90735 RepID=UPI003CCFA67D
MFIKIFLTVLFCTVWSEKYSLYYTYTALSRPVNVEGIYEFTAVGFLNDRAIDYYNSKDQVKIPKQPWMKKKMPPDYWEAGTLSRKKKQQWFNDNIQTLIGRTRQNNTDVHVLQWRCGCEIEKNSVSEEHFVKGIWEIGYDGEDFISFNNKESMWVYSVNAALSTLMQWNNISNLNLKVVQYLEGDCVESLNKFRNYEKEEFRKLFTPKIHVFAKKSLSGRLNMTCLATGFYPKDVMLSIRKNEKSLPEYELESTGVRPNHDGSYQLRKSASIREEDVADYDCYMTHRTLEYPKIIKLSDGPEYCGPISVRKLMVVVVGICFCIGVIIIFLLCILKKDRTILTRGQATTTQQNVQMDQMKGTCCEEETVLLGTKDKTAAEEQAVESDSDLKNQPDLPKSIFQSETWSDGQNDSGLEVSEQCTNSSYASSIECAGT